MAKFNFNGTLMSDDFAEIMRWFGWNDNVCPLDIRNLCKDADGEEIELYINSDGGSLIAGTEIYSILKEYKGNVVGHIQSRAASAATVAMMACDKIIAQPVSLVCVHNPTTSAQGEAEDMRHTAEELDNVKNAILAAYTSRASVKVGRDELSELMDKNMWINADRAVEYGFVDEIDGEEAGEGIILNAATPGNFPTQKMIDEYRAAKNEEKNKINAAKAFIEIYK